MKTQCRKKGLAACLRAKLTVSRRWSMNVSDFQRSRFLMKTAEWPCSCNNTQAPILIECGVPSTRATISLIKLVMAAAVIKPRSETLKRGSAVANGRSVIGCLKLPSLGKGGSLYCVQTVSFPHCCDFFAYANEYAHTLPRHGLHHTMAAGIGPELENRLP